MAYDAAKAAEYNKLIQQGLSPAAAAAQAGISESDGNYQINEIGTPATNPNYGKLERAGLNQPDRRGSDTFTSDADEDTALSLPALSQSRTTTSRVEVTQSSTTTTTSGGGTTTRYGGSLPTQSSTQYSAQAATSQSELDKFNQENPGPLQRRRLGLPPLTAEENQARLTQQAALADQVNQNLTLSQTARQPVSSGESFVPNTTTTEVTSTGALTAYRSVVNTNSDQVLGEQAQVQFDSRSVQVTGSDNVQLRTDYGVVIEELDLQKKSSLTQANQIKNQLATLNSQQQTLAQQLEQADYAGDPELKAVIQSRIDQNNRYISGANLALTNVQKDVASFDQSLNDAFAKQSAAEAGPGLMNSVPAPGSAAPGSVLAVPAPAVTVNSVSLGDAVNPASDPSQFPAYDDDGNLQPGFALNNEDGQPYYKGFDITTKQAVTPPSDYGTAYTDFTGLDQAVIGQAGNVNDPYYGLSPQQLQDLGGADPTDPYIRARLGIPQLPGSTLNPSGFAALQPTGVPLIDNALTGISNFANSLTSLFRPATKPEVTTQGTTTGAPVVPVVDAQAAAVEAAAVQQQNTELSADAQADLLDIQAANAEIQQGRDNIAANNRQVLASEENIALAQENQRQASAIIEQNNAELADPLLDPERRAELEANNAENFEIIAANGRAIDTELDNIAQANLNTAEQQISIFTNEGLIQDAQAGFVANTANPDALVEADDDPGLVAGGAEDNIFAELDEDVNADNDPGLFGVGDEEIDPFTELAEPVDPDADPFEQQRIEAEQQLNRDELTREAVDVEPGEDPFEASRLEAEARLDEPPTALSPDDVEPIDPFEQQRIEAEQQLNRDELTREAADVPPSQAGPIGTPYDDDGNLNPGWTLDENNNPVFVGGDFVEPATAESAAASREAAAKQRTINQATLQSRYRQPGNSDWRVRLQLAPTSDYLYNAGGNDPNASGILAPLRKTNGVVFPYTPTISTSYQANYEQYDLVHSNYRGIYYKNSRVNDVNVRAIFTAQDTAEANYLLAVIHFFRSVTKMFYGQDPNRGVPPPLVFLNGFGDFQFNKHPCVVASFNYTLPSDVDYIRATNYNNYGGNLFDRRQPVATAPGGVQFAGAIRLANALLPKQAKPQVPTQNTLRATVTNTDRATYVPTKMEMDINLIPVQTRDQVSNQFSLKEFANGNLIKGGFW